jgi:hypothetical protein
MIANGLAHEVERRRGAESGFSNANTQLVAAKLEMVRANWLFQLVGIVPCLCLLNRADRVQRDEVH